MLTVDDARARILDEARPLGIETVALADARGRVLAGDLVARRTQPPQAMSAMDGWALRTGDLAAGRTEFHVVGVSRAGSGFTGMVDAGQTARIFTGAPVPDGADIVVIQEDTHVAAHDDDGQPLRMALTDRVEPVAGANIRPAGIDFATGAVGLQAGRVMDARAIALAAAMGHPWLQVIRQPRVGVLATGDELVRPGEPMGPDTIVDAVTPALMALIQDAGAVPVDLGIAPDGEQKIAMRPGKPLMYGRMGGMPVLGLPGNPVSAFICSWLFALPLIDRLAGRTPRDPAPARLPLAAPVAQNTMRQHYMRARLQTDADGHQTVLPVRDQDSSLLSALADADALILRRPHAPAAEPGTEVEVLRLSPMG